MMKRIKQLIVLSLALCMMISGTTYSFCMDSDKVNVPIEYESEYGKTYIELICDDEHLKKVVSYNDSTDLIIESELNKDTGVITTIEYYKDELNNKKMYLTHQYNYGDQISNSITNYDASPRNTVVTVYKLFSKYQYMKETRGTRLYYELEIPDGNRLYTKDVSGNNQYANSICQKSELFKDYIQNGETLYTSFWNAGKGVLESSYKPAVANIIDYGAKLFRQNMTQAEKQQVILAGATLVGPPSFNAMVGMAYGITSATAFYNARQMHSQVLSLNSYL